MLFYAKNNEDSPVQCLINITSLQLLDTNNLRPCYNVIPPQVSSYFLFSLPLKYADSTVLRFQRQEVLGDPKEIKTASEFVYWLPYRHGSRHRIIQGFNGKFSHRRQYALDFKMKEGTPICAARSGVVVQLRMDSNRGGKTPAFAKDANYIVVLHQDGSFAYYYHLQQNSQYVYKGSRVNAGDVIARSGNTGFSTTPHLHFVVKVPVYMNQRSVPIKFLTGKFKFKKPRAYHRYKAYHPR